MQNWWLEGGLAHSVHFCTSSKNHLRMQPRFHGWRWHERQFTDIVNVCYRLLQPIFSFIFLHLVERCLESKWRARRDLMNFGEYVDEARANHRSSKLGRKQPPWDEGMTDHNRITFLWNSIEILIILISQAWVFHGVPAFLFHRFDVVHGAWSLRSRSSNVEHLPGRSGWSYQSRQGHRVPWSTVKSTYFAAADCDRNCLRDEGRSRLSRRSCPNLFVHP